MAMKFGLHTSLSLNQVLTPQMRMNLELIQAPILEAVSALEQEVMANPWLERNEEQTDPRFVRDADRQPESTIATPTQQREYDEAEAWFEAPSTPWTHEEFPADEAQGPIAVKLQTPYEQLEAQLTELDVTRQVMELVQVLICNLDEHGYLATNEEELAEFLGVKNETQAQTLQDALHAMRYQMDPPGIGACDQAHCYLIQLERQGKKDSLAARVVREGALAEIKPRNLAQVARKLGVKEQELHEALDDLRRLYAHPLSLLDQTTEPTRYPDLIVENIDGDWIVSLSHPLSGRYRFRETKIPRKKALVAELNGSAEEEDPAKILERLRGMRQNARMMVNATEYRDRTLYEIGRHLVKEQREFLEKGEEALKPLLQKELAEALNMNEATISRILKDKYMLTPRGLIPMSAFFSRSITSDDGEKVSNKAVMDALQKLINEEEDPERPWSDQEISDILKERNFPISRRTVTKYRQNLGIGSASDRKAMQRLRESTG
ncbi:MAG: RNA polymerase factor sigma-54 [Candidatus Eisenbacteria bacterium]|uniref:RNA polymerase factor sigma-54 n=1 Tax=Eiseniibacteriota bacterium TaxID=2212470 RepID=A0A956M0N6_UNCEI|nr:RNA polymerase factor sigma-54 [Candidatus Eisenbacteria bacterium]